jgi:hypothetical protein
MDKRNDAPFAFAVRAEVRTYMKIRQKTHKWEFRDRN